MKITKGYTFDDVLLSPKYSEVKTRKSVDLSVDLGKGVKLDIPIVSSNMRSVTGYTMARKLAGLGGLPILHRFCTISENVEMFQLTDGHNVGCSIGVHDTEKERFQALYDVGCRIFCIDVAHGDHVNCIEMIKRLSESYNNCLIIAGNIATGEGALRLAKAGADVVKCGIGGGSICSTRIQTGNGVPQMTALHNVKTILDDYESSTGQRPKVIADGGIRNGGDVVKSLCFADAVMLGSMLAGTNEAPGEITQINGKSVKAYEGSSTHKTSHIEGIKIHVPLKGPVTPIITTLLDGVKSGCSYQGVDNLTDLKKDPHFIEISNAGLIESHPHNIISKG